MRLMAISLILTMSSISPHRLVQVDALRGVAALAVVLFHYTTRFAELFGAGTLPSLSFPDGHYGVNLFFIISGFVIFMTLEKTVKPMDFVVSRFSRLFPAYWGAIFLTFFISHLLGLPGKLVGAGTAIANMVMVHSFFGVPNVDGVYWTLEVELLFYCGMFILYQLKGLDRVQYVLFGLLLLRVIYFISERYFGIDLPWIVFRLLILKFIPWFALGISIYLAVNRTARGAWRQTIPTSAAAIATLCLCESIFVAGLALVLATAVYFAAQNRFSLLRFKPVVWLGTISYPLYLLHENIGWALMLKLQSVGISMDMTIFLTLCTSLLLAGAVTYRIEQPAMRWIRSRYQKRADVLA
jgi:peptidoglycan/LPS O-acetylase OafA/YrhL